MVEGEGWVPLSAAIKLLRSEVTAAMSVAQGEDLQFRLGQIELEFRLGVTNEGGGEAGIKFWVVTLGAKGSHTRDQTHTVKMTLTPHQLGDPDGDVDIATTGQLG